MTAKPAFDPLVLGEGRIDCVLFRDDGVCQVFVTNLIMVADDGAETSHDLGQQWLGIIGEPVEILIRRKASGVTA